VHEIAELERTTHVPTLGVVPDAARFSMAGSTELMKLSEPYSITRQDRREHHALLASLQNTVIAEAFRSVRTSLVLSRPQDPANVLLFTSGMPNEGKTFSSLNLAAALACSGSEVLLVDADLRRATLSRALGQRSRKGLSEALLGQNGFSDEYSSYVQPVERFPRLWFAAAGACQRSPSELLQSQRMSEILADWRRQFSFVVIDSPPVLPVTDAAVLAPKVDAVIVVVRHRGTNMQAVRRTIRILRDVQAPRLSILMNAMDSRSVDHYRYSGMYGYYDYTADDISNRESA
jgi:capsular exopolysaccharide synthesis family protein